MPGLATDVRPVAAAAPLLAPAASARRDLAPGLAAAVALAGGLILYLATAAPAVQGGDSGEFQFVAYVLGIPHPPGYPFYAVFGKLWTLLVPLGEIARRMNLMSAAFAASALAALAWAAARAYRGGPGGLAAGLVAALWLAVGPTWWSQATIASVRAPTGFFVAALLAALASFAATGRPAWLYTAAALYGLGLTHHISLYTLAPLLLLFVLITAPGPALRPAVLGRALMAGALPLLLYLYLPIRSAIGTEFDASHPTTPAAFFALVSARGFAGDMLYFDPLAPERLELGRQILLTTFGTLGVAFAVAGGLVTLFWRPRWFLLTGGVALVNLAISLSYRAPVIADYLIPTYAVMALWIGALAAAAGRAIRSVDGPWLASAAALLVAAALALPPFSYARSAWTSFDLSADLADRRFLAAAFDAAAPGGTILTDWYHATILWYGQLALGQRRDLRVEYVAPEGAEVPWLRRAEAALAGGPVYTTALDRELGARHHLRRIGVLYEVAGSGAPAAPPADATPVAWRYGDAIELIAYRLETPPDGADVAVSLYWTAHGQLAQEYREFVHLTDAAGRVWGQRDGSPGEGLYGTTRWRPGELVAERYALTVAPSAPAGQLALRVGLYETLPTPPGWRRLEAHGPDRAALGDAPVLTSVGVRPLVIPPDPRAAPLSPLPAPPRGHPAPGEGQGEGVLAGRGDALTRHPERDQPGDVLAAAWRASAGRAVSRLDRILRGDGAQGGVPGWATVSGRLWLPFGKRALLTGWSLERAEAAPGETLRVALDFLPLTRIPEDAAVFVHLVDQAGVLRAQSDSVPVAGGLPTLRWAPDRSVRDTRSLRLPPDLVPGDYSLRAGLYVMATGAHLPVLDDRLAREGQGEHVVLTELRVRP
ncbi:MAG TPA: DUF2723 domain-containing protein [Chloroflexota bacterium]|nr:DUF2723 domain-containing protein [Chloroflexota bacterium]